MGEVFAGRYELVDPIGRGGVGAVWRTWDHRRRRYVAAKVLQQRDAHALLRFVREQAVRIDHPHVLAPASWAADDDKVLFTMDLVAGGSLVNLVNDYGPLPPAYVCGLLDQLLSGLAAVHAEGVIHRDIKPANVLLEATGTARPRLRLSDFGIAMRLGEPRLTETNYVVGTPGYFAPEQMLGADPDFPADLFAVGLVALYLLEGAKPDAKALIEHFAAHGTPKAPRGIPEPLWQVIATLLQPDPDSRFRTATGARKALAAAIELLPEPGPDDELVDVFDQLGPLPQGFAPEGPLHRASGLDKTDTGTGSGSGTGTGSSSSPAPGPGTPAAPPHSPGPHPPSSFPASGASSAPAVSPLVSDATPPPPHHPPVYGPPPMDPPSQPGRGPATPAPLPGAGAQPPYTATGSISPPPMPTTAPPRTGSADSGNGSGNGSGVGFGTGPAGTGRSGTASGTDSGVGTGQGTDPWLPDADTASSGSSASPTHTGHTPPESAPSAAPPRPESSPATPRPSTMSDTGSFHLPPPQVLTADAPPQQVEQHVPGLGHPPQQPEQQTGHPAGTPVRTAPAHHPGPAHVPSPQSHPPLGLSQAPASAVQQHAYASTGSYTARPAQVPRRSRAVPRRRPGPPAKVVIPVLLVALACFAVGFWALGRL
ncbi:protein kinase [Streptomyces sp. ID01-12c]|uniref:non-specific serine/threonine protein kinase n=1 Tax=Streptomyces caniscabiei TaxID=2746961 RepID=A0A927L8U6_9ACTN|nr:serine/threonine-protein kinase [Streptomyces caniscabiei]MBD9701622.1 protein kinase [Streptomyces caniscabiei]MBD9724643.1 protein kinase [Streptomyces caniscabiei]MDX3508057.1 protein kinase [Streptomyces caniscabiei]MDX3718019.1 protein kinase [Streptomyces caniscabiei]MDX3726317.1 protein kinase [Streptomyces caniscabiei]